MPRTEKFQPDDFFRGAEATMTPIFDEIQHIYSTEREQERIKKENLFDSRYRSLQKIGIENIRAARLKRLEVERWLWHESFSAAHALLPDIKLLLAVKVTGKE